MTKTLMFSDRHTPEAVNAAAAAENAGFLSGDFEISVVQMPHGIPKWHLVNDFLGYRKRVFIDELDWQLNQFEGIEYEQYDTFDAVYVVAHRGPEVCGGARLRQTDRVNGTGSSMYSYMIRDAHLGMLPGMPTDLCFEEPPQSRKIWELTRLATSQSFQITKSVLHGANRFLRTQTAEHCFFLGSPAFMRMARSMGFAPAPLGPVVSNRDGRFIAFSCPVNY